ncbi:MAG: outer membrane protein transport protein [Halioglobus sp.]
MKISTFITANLTCLAVLTVCNANAGGLWLNQYGDFASGMSSAGASAGGDEAATIIHNPASGTGIEGSQLFASVGAIIPTMEFDLEYTNPINGDDDGGSAGLDAPLASMAYVHDLNSEKWSLGIYTAGLAGAGLEYNREWAGRFQNTKVELLLLTVAPTVGYQLTDSFSVGLAAQYYYGSLDFELGLPTRPNRAPGKATLDGTDSGFSYALGAVWALSDTTSIGLNYQSEVALDFDGKLKLENNIESISATSNTELNMAQFVRLGLHHELNDQWALGLTLGWDDWSTMKDVFVSLPEVEAGLARNWEDTYHYAAGFQYAANRDWDITAGIAYDTNPVDAEDRTADMPIDRQIRYTGGARYQLSESLTLGGYLNYTDLGSAKIRTGQWGGEYDKNEVLEFSLYLNWLI